MLLQKWLSHLELKRFYIHVQSNWVTIAPSDGHQVSLPTLHRLAASCHHGSRPLSDSRAAGLSWARGDIWLCRDRWLQDGAQKQFLVNSGANANAFPPSCTHTHSQLDGVPLGELHFHGARSLGFQENKVGSLGCGWHLLQRLSEDLLSWPRSQAFAGRLACCQC